MPRSYSAATARVQQGQGLVVPFAWSISNGIGAGFVSYVAIKVLNGKRRQVHGLMYGVAAAFVLYFVSPVLEKAVAR